eukprot:766663-Hanusia_phi.AAC.5
MFNKGAMRSARLASRACRSRPVLLLLAPLQLILLSLTCQLQASAAFSSSGLQAFPCKARTHLAVVGSVRIQPSSTRALRLRGGFFGIGSKSTEVDVQILSERWKD